MKIGLEIHQQLDTRKLFCNCPSLIRNDDNYKEIVRELHLAYSEMNEIDIAMEFEMLKGKKFVYQYYDTNCDVELDEYPPHNVNKEALRIALTVAKMLNCKIVDEIQVMRKLIIDGSNTSGFQRTMLIGYDGYLDCSFGKVPIQTVCLEEDSARKIKEDENFIYYRLDRLGIPLVEIATAPVMKNEKEVVEVAKKIGLILRLTGKVKRGLGTIRQDINVSIEGGNRVEIKGVQKLEDIKEIVKREEERQKNIIKIGKELNGKVSFSKEVNVTSIFKNTKCRFIKKAIENGNEVYSFKIENMANYFKKEICKGKRLAIEVLDYPRVIIGLKGFIHSDEDLSRYGFEKEIGELKKVLNCKDKDLFIIVVGKEKFCKRAIELIKERINMLLEGVPKEVRKVNEDLTTSFLRLLPTSARMYPETDCLPIESKKYIPSKLPWNIEEWKAYLESLNLSEVQILKLLDSPYLFQFKEIYDTTKANPRVIAKVLLETLRSLKRDNFDVDKVSKEILIEVFKNLKEGVIVKESVEEILKEICKGKKAKEAIDMFKVLSKEELKREIKKLINEVKDKSKVKKYVISRLRGKGKIEDILKILEELNTK